MNDPRERIAAAEPHPKNDMLRLPDLQIFRPRSNAENRPRGATQSGRGAPGDRPQQAVLVAEHEADVVDRAQLVDALAKLKFLVAKPRDGIGHQK